jgi:hypothetical protein
VQPGDKLPIVGFGDGLSSDRFLIIRCSTNDDYTLINQSKPFKFRMRSAQDHMLNCDDDAGKAHKIVAGNSAWHKEVLLLQV